MIFFFFIFCCQGILTLIIWWLLFSHLDVETPSISINSQPETTFADEQTDHSAGTALLTSSEKKDLVKSFLKQVHCLSYVFIPKRNLIFFNLNRDWSPKFETGLNIIIGIVQKVKEWPSCPFAKMMYSWGNHLCKRKAWSLVYFLNCAYYDIYPSLKFWWPVSSNIKVKFIAYGFWQDLTDSKYPKNGKFVLKN